MMATATEIAAMRRRYLWMATSIFFLDLAITLIFSAAMGSWNNFWRSEGMGIVLLGAANWLIARRLFEPIRRFLAGELPFDDIQRRLTQLPLLTARYVGLLAIVVIGFRNSTPWWVESHVMYDLRPTIAEGQALMRALRERLSGLAMPTYVLDLPGARGKIPIGPGYLEGEGPDYVAADPKGGRAPYCDFGCAD